MIFSVMCFFGYYQNVSADFILSAPHIEIIIKIAIVGRHIKQFQPINIQLTDSILVFLCRNDRFRLL